MIYFVLTLFSKNIYLADSSEYLNQVINMGKHLNWYCGDFNEQIDLDLFSRRPPMYGLFLFLIKSIVNSDFAVLFVQSALSIFNILGVLSLLNFYKFNVSSNRVVLIFVILYPSQLLYCNLIMTEILFQTFLFWGFYNIFLFLKDNKFNHLLYYNILIALATLTKPVLFYFWIPNLLFLTYLFLRKRKFPIILSGFIPLIVVLLISSYNYNKTGYFHYSSIKNNNLLYYNSYFLLIRVYGKEEGSKKFAKIVEHVNSINDYSIKSSEKERIGFETILDNKLSYAKFQSKGMLNFFLDPGRFDLINFIGIKEKNNEGLLFAFAREGYSGVMKFILNQPIYIVIYLIIVLLINIVMIASIIYLPFVKRIDVNLKIYFFLILVYLSFISGPFSTLRYKIPIYPIILFTIPFFVEGLKNRFLTRSSNRKKVN